MYALLKRSLVVVSLFVSMAVQAQKMDERVAALINGSNWFELEHVLATSPAESTTPFLWQMAKAMTHHYFNRPDSACVVLADLLNRYPRELGDQTMSMVLLLGMNLARTGGYSEASGLMQNLCDQLSAAGMDSMQVAPYGALAQQYRSLAACGPICQPLHETVEYRIPMMLGNDGGQHFIEINGSLNGKEGRMLFDTGAGSNMITPAMAEEYGLRSLDTEITVGGYGGMKQGYYAIADTLRIGKMTWVQVPFIVVDLQTGNAEADRIGRNLQLPPVIGLPVMLRMQEIQMDFADREIIVPAEPTPNPLAESNLLRTDTEGLRLKAVDETGAPLYFHFDTGSYFTNMQPAWYARHQHEVDTTGVPDSLRMAGVGGVSITRSYTLPRMEFRIGHGTAVLDSVSVNTGIDLHTGEPAQTAFSDGTEDGVLGLNALEKFSKVILNFKEMYMEAIPYAEEP